MIRRRWIVFCVGLACLPQELHAQRIAGVAEWVWARGMLASSSHRTTNNSFSQNYTIGYRSVVWDPRFLQYNGEVSFRTNRLTFGEQDGRSRDLGFKVGVNLFPTRPFPLSVQVLRNGITEAGDLQSASVIRGGIASGPGAAIAEYVTRNSGVQAKWALTTVRLPRVDVSYKSESSHVSGGGYDGEQRGHHINANVSKDGTRVRQTLRFQRDAFQSALSEAFDQRLSDLAYDLSASIGKRSRTVVRAGRRSSLSLFDVPPTITDIGVPSYAAPATGGSTVYYAQGSVSWEPTSTVSTDVTLSADRAQEVIATTKAYLLSSGGSWTIVKGLSVNARGTYGIRGQDVAGNQLTVTASSVGGGVNYHTSFKFLQVGGGYSAFEGKSAGIADQTGRTSGWGGRANAGTSFSRIPNVTASFERQQSSDELLELGNQWTDKWQAAVHGTLFSRISVQGGWEDAISERGRGTLFTRTHLVTTSGSLGYRSRRGFGLAMSAGRFVHSAGPFEQNRTRFLTGSADATAGRSLRVSVNVRYEAATVGISGQELNTMFSLAKIEYRLRLFTFALEHRYTGTAYRLVKDTSITSRGHQVMLRVSRRFGY